MAKQRRKQYFEGDLPMMCEYPGCEKHALIDSCSKTKIRFWAKSELLRKLYNKVDGYVCSRHRELLMAENKQMSNFYYQDKIRKNESRAPRKFVREYCENRDGRLGFKCTTTLPPPDLIKKTLQASDPYADGYCRAWLDVDHIDGNSANNDIKNLQTLCKVCHSFKTLKCRDMESPGRKAIRDQKKARNLWEL